MRTLDLNNASSITGTGVRIGTLVAVNKSGVGIVDYPGNSLGPLEARSAVQLSAEATAELPVGIVLLLDETAPLDPVIVGLVRPELIAPVPAPTRKVTIDGDTVVLRGRKEVRIECGKSSIQLTRTGKVVVKGTKIINRSSGDNKIQGATISLN